MPMLCHDNHKVLRKMKIKKEESGLSPNRSPKKSVGIEPLGFELHRALFLCVI